MTRTKRPSVSINRLIIGLADQRNLILEGSEYYKSNMAVLTSRLAAIVSKPAASSTVRSMGARLRRFCSLKDWGGLTCICPVTIGLALGLVIQERSCDGSLGRTALPC